MNRRRLLRNWILAPLAVVLVSSSIIGSASGSGSIAGSQGIDTSLPPTNSQVTIAGRGPWADLKITVNQTKNLTDQAISLTWEGGQPTLQDTNRFAGNFLQIFQCWGDDDGANPENPGPPPEQCAQGAVSGAYNGVPAAALPAGSATKRIISVRDWANYDPTVGQLDTRTGVVWRPFRAVDGTVINEHVDPTFTPSRPGGNYWLNPYFSIVTTNEIAASTTLDNGRGSELFQVATGLQSSGLGCGQRVEKVGDDLRVPKCWIVIVPRGTPAVENVGTPFGERAEVFGVYTSPLAPEAWANRIAVPLEFSPVDSSCSLAAKDRRIAGNELASPAISRWQPALCGGGILPPFTYAPVPDSAARGFITKPTSGAPGMAVVQRPIDPSSVSPDNPIVYAPLTVSGLTLGFNVERIPRFDAGADVQALAGIRIADINLTPRLVAKLLTQSYVRQLEIFEAPDYEWLDVNPAHLGDDPDFIQFNPEFASLSIFEGRTFSGLQLSAGTSDAAEQVWKWVLSDPEAAAWLGGEPDQWGMQVNPAYATDAAKNSNGIAFGNPAPNSFPKADPYCYQAAPLGAAVPPPLCGTDWMPYSRSLVESASRARRAFDGARIALNVAAQSASQVWGGTTPQIIGRRSIIALTDTSSATLFGLQAARLSRAGDNGQDRTFIAPDSKGLLAGLEAMEPGVVPEVVEPTNSAAAAGAYPLTTLTYAAIAPLSLDDEARSDYAAFLEYAADAGQVRGTGLGQLPVGYEPLSPSLSAQTRAAAQAVRELQPTPAAVPPATSPPATSPPAASPPAASPPAASPPAASPAVSAASPRARSSANASSTATAPVVEAIPPTDEPAATAVGEVAETADEVPAAVEAERAVVSTPAQDVGVVRVAVPVLGVMALGSALFALELTKRPRRTSDLGGDASEGRQ